MTAQHDWFLEHLPAFVARSLDAEEEAQFADHLARCPECRDAVAALEHDLAWLPLGAPPTTPRPGFRRLAFERALGVRRLPRWTTWVPVGLAAALLISVTYAFSLRQELAQVQDTLATRTDQLVALQRADRIVQANFAMDSLPGEIVIFADTATHHWNVVVRGLPSGAKGVKHTFWFVTDKGTRRSVEVPATPSRVASFSVGMPWEDGKMMDVKGAGLSAEPMDSQGDTPKGQVLALLSM
jgi:hypothetical protein